MITERLLRKASHALASSAATGVVATGLLLTAGLAHAQYNVSDSQLQSDVKKTIQNDSMLKGSNIQATVSQGVVTLSGNATDESVRVEAENAAAGVSGVRSIQDNVTIPGGNQTPAASPTAAAASAPPPAETAQSSGMPPAPPATTQAAAPSATTSPNPTASGASGAGVMPPPPPADTAAKQQQEYTPFEGGNAGEQDSQIAQGGYGADGGYGAENGGYGPRGNAHPPQSQVQTFGVSPQQQNASGPVTIPAGTLLSVRTTQPMSTGNLKGGEFFQVTAAADVYANGVVAIPRGAILNGQVVEAKNAGAFGGSPKLDLRLTSIQLGPTSYPLVSEVWSSQGPSKTGYTATNTAGGAIFGALIGAIAGGGVGAGVGAIAGGTGGALVSGATHGPQLDLQPEALLQFHLAQPLTVQPVQYNEAQRLAASVPQQPVLRQRPQYVAVPYPAPYGYPPPYPYGYDYYYPRY